MKDARTTGPVRPNGIAAKTVKRISAVLFVIPIRTAGKGWKAGSVPARVDPLINTL
ncbi:MAG: hypothetical protein GF392_03240 [Candidatus Omnitrophica bacterium]|nr:hypothetical protein [Candidatus Omnitrophota bacterium]